LSEWEITCKEFCPRRGKQNDNNDKKSRQQASKLKEFPPRICHKCRQPGHYANTCPNPRLNKSRSQRQGSKASKSQQNKKSNMQGRQDQRDFMGSVSSWEHPSLWFAVNCWFVNHPLWTFDGNVYAPRCPKANLASDILISIVFDLEILNVFILILRTTLWTHKTWVERVKLCSHALSIILSCMGRTHNLINSWAWKCIA
jgi:hypothetical protein